MAHVSKEQLLDTIRPRETVDQLLQPDPYLWPGEINDAFREER